MGTPRGDARRDAHNTFCREAPEGYKGRGNPARFGHKPWEASATPDYKHGTDGERKLGPGVIAGLMTPVNLDIGKGLEPRTVASGSSRPPSEEQQAPSARILPHHASHLFTGEIRVAWIAHMKLLMDGLGLRDEERLQVAPELLNTKASRWYTLAFRAGTGQQRARTSRWNLWSTTRLTARRKPYTGPAKSNNGGRSVITSTVLMRHWPTVRM